jgi:hypothetical protein
MLPSINNFKLGDLHLAHFPTKDHHPDHTAWNDVLGLQIVMEEMLRRAARLLKQAIEVEEAEAEAEEPGKEIKIDATGAKVTELFIKTEPRIEPLSNNVHSLQNITKEKKEDRITRPNYRREECI